MSQVQIDAVNEAALRLVGKVRELKLPLIESDDTEHSLNQLNAIVAAVASVVAAIKELENSKPSIYEKRGLIEL